MDLDLLNIADYEGFSDLRKPSFYIENLKSFRRQKKEILNVQSAGLTVLEMVLTVPLLLLPVL